MKETSEQIISTSIHAQREYFNSQATKPVKFRIKQLEKLKSVIQKNETAIQDALWKDLHKSPEEAYLTEISIVLSEIKNHIKNLKNWAQPTRVSTPIHLFPSSSKIHYEPLGVALVVAPWNYPFQLLFNPLVGAISAGCCCILKPSPDTPEIAKLMEQMIHDTFDSNYVDIFQGAKETNTILFNSNFDLIFFTGSPRLGKIVMKAAAEKLTPVILELGGKSPAIVDKNANLNLAAKRLIWGKLLNSGQTCIAPDYLLAHEEIKDKLISKIIENIKEMFGENVEKSNYYGRIVTESAFERLVDLIPENNILFGGNSSKDELFIEPTILDNVSEDSAIMQEEIFGPILPVLTFSHVSKAVDFVNKNEKPLALYYFGTKKTGLDVIQKTSSGGACINDTMIHIGNHNLPFGGVGNSGLGQYHGKHSFLAFSHSRAIVSSSSWLDIPFKYVPFKYFKFIKRFI